MSEKSGEHLRSERLLSAFDKGLGIKETSLGQALGKAKRRLPLRQRRSAQVLAQAEQNAAHPKLHKISRHADLDRARTDVLAYLQDVDAAELRKTRRINLLGEVAIRMFILAGMFAATVTWLTPG